MHQIHLCDNLDLLVALPDQSVQLIYIDPPFNTGSSRRHTPIRVTPSEPHESDRIGFQGRAYRTDRGVPLHYPDRHEDFLGFLEPRLRHAHRVLASHGALYFHIDYREVHYCKVLLDEIFGRESFLNEIIWAYDYGGRSRRKWPAKHDNILYYVKNPKQYTFNSDAVDRIPYMAPGLVTPEKVARGKLPTDTWWHTIVPTRGSERTGYPTQKPMGIVRRIIAASSNPGDLVLDFFAGSGTTGAVCLEMNRRFILADNNPEALRVMHDRLGSEPGIAWYGYPATDPLLPTAGRPA